MSMTDDEVLKVVRLEHTIARANNFEALAALEGAKRIYDKAEQTAQTAALALHTWRGVLTRVEWARRVKGQK